MPSTPRIADHDRETEPIKVLLIDDEADTLLPRLRQHLRGEGFAIEKETEASRTEQAIGRHAPNLVLLDLHFPGDDRPCDGRTTGGKLLTGIRRQHPALPVLVFTTRLDDHDHPLETFEERPHGRFAKSVLDNNSNWPAILSQAVRDAMATARFEHEAHDDNFGFLIGQTQAMREVAARIRTAARNRLPVLIYGETGTGKQRAAEAIHRLSSRAGRFEQLNCSGIDESTLEAKLFGHERGAYTGAATAREGLFELADGGTLFLDEIQRMPMALQNKLMLVIEQGKIRRMGATADRKVDVRLVAATNDNLSDLVDEDLLRKDLAHRLCGGLDIALPALRDRLADLPVLFEHFVDKANGELGRHVLTVLRNETRKVLEAHAWPGNIRELEATVCRAVATTTSNVLLPEDIQFVPLAPRSKPAAPPSAEPQPEETSDPYGVKTASDDALIASLCDRLEALPLEQRYAFVLEQGTAFRAGVLIEFICRLRQRKGRKIRGKELATALDPCDGGERDFAKIRQLLSSCGISLSRLECNQ